MLDGGGGRSVGAERRLNMARQTVLAVVVMAMVVGCEATKPVLYEELGLAINATADEIVAAYQQIARTWTADKQYELAEIQKIIDIEHAYHVLSNNLSRRDYDLFRIDVLETDVNNIRQLYNGRTQPDHLQFPLWTPRRVGESIESTAETVTFQNFGDLVLDSSDLWVIQIYSVASPECHAFAPVWDTAMTQLEGVVRVGRLELGEMPLSIYLAERNWMHGYPFFRNGLPAIFAVRPGCQRLNCIDRYHDEKSSESIADWVATRLLRLPRILYYTSHTLMTDIIQKTGPHKIKVIQFSETGQRAPLYLRKAARDYWEYAVFAMVLWRESEATFWESKVGVEYGPATVFLKDPGLAPVIHHGKLSSPAFHDLLERHKTFELPQLRSITAAELGCDVTRYSLPVKETKIWYCVIVAGRSGMALSQLRGVLRLAQEYLLSSTAEETPSVTAFRDKRLRLAWLDGEIQKEFCYFYLNSESMFDSCGPVKYGVDDIPRIFLIRYIREAQVENIDSEKKRWLPKSVWEKQSEEEKSYAAQIVTKYNGSSDYLEIVEWMSTMITQGDKEDLPSFRGRAPDLVVEETIPFTAKTQEFVARKKDKLVDRGKGFFRVAQDFKRDPKFIPLVLFIVLFYTAAFYLRAKHKRSLTNQVQEETTLELPDKKNATSEDIFVPDDSGEQMTSARSQGLRRRETFQSS